MKIDVEGFELHVLKGMTRLLMESPPKHIFCEIHFERLDKMGLRKGAEYITDLLNHRGYKVQWFGSSHIHAEPQKSRSSE